MLEMGKGKEAAKQLFEEEVHRLREQGRDDAQAMAEAHAFSTRWENYQPRLPVLTFDAVGLTDGFTMSDFKESEANKAEAASERRPRRRQAR